MFAEFYFFLTITTETRQVASWLSSTVTQRALCLFFSADVALMTLEFLRSRAVLRFAEVNLWEWMF